MVIRRRSSHDEASTIIMASSSGGTSLKRTTDRGRLRKRKASYLRAAFTVPVFIIMCTLWRLVDLSFLGGRWLVESRLSSNDITDDGEEDATANNFPDGWESYSYNDIRDHFDCRSRSKDNGKALPRIEDWQLMRNAFKRAVYNTKEWDDPVPPTLGYSLERKLPIPPPYYANVSPGKGRGLFASRDIAKGELVHDGTHSDVIFPSSLAWRRYVFSLPRELACDSTDWLWMQKLEKGGHYYLLTGMNISVLMNSGGEEFGPGRIVNTLPASSTSGRFYATRDIAKGDEILTDYDAYYTNWKKVGL